MGTPTEFSLPAKRDLFYGGQWHEPLGGYAVTLNPATQEQLGPVAQANTDDVNQAVLAAHEAFKSWRRTLPIERATALRALATRLRENADELAWLDSINCGNPIREMKRDVLSAAAQLDYYAGLVYELKGETLPMGEDVVKIGRASCRERGESRTVEG